MMRMELSGDGVTSSTYVLQPTRTEGSVMNTDKSWRHDDDGYVHWSGATRRGEIILQEAVLRCR